MTDFDYDQREDDDSELDALSQEIFNAGVESALKAVLIALDQEADIRKLCEAALAKFEKKEKPDA